MLNKKIISIVIIVIVLLILLAYWQLNKKLPDHNLITQPANLSNRENNDETKKELLALKNEVNRLKKQNQRITEANQNINLSLLIDEWKDRVAEVTCEWQYRNGTVWLDQQGSAFIANLTNLGVTAITNKHVLRGVAFDGKDYLPIKCSVGVYGIGGREAYFNDSPKPFYLGANEDWAYIVINNATVATDNGFFTNLPLNYNVCTGANVGDQVVILGYPAIGTTNGITATEGIISGVEQDYYVTSAKIDHGNSGGAAVLIKNDCYLGIPTWAETGTIESLGRILKSSFVIGK